jgi:acyloxyacyl hydrolase
MESLSRHPWEDKPAIVVYSMVGNDVCNGMEDTVAHMTSVEEFHTNVLSTLDFLQGTLPAGSHVILVGLIDGSLIYKAMAQRLHPLGLLKQDLTYADVYDWFNCMEIGPCHGWMSRNATLRAITTAHAQRLSKVLMTIAEKQRFTRFDVHYMPNPFQQVIDRWVAKGGQLWQLIEPVDSLHPTQVTQAMIAESMWTHLEQHYPHVLGPVNERNERIAQLFGDQGGH